MAFTHVAESILALRVYALSGERRTVPIICSVIIVAQWAIALYLAIHSFGGSAQVALLLSPPIFPFPAVPAIDAYNVCLFIATSTVNPLIEAWLSLSLTYESIIFLSIVYLTFKTSREIPITSLTSVIYIIRRDGILYFIVLFFSSLVWLILLLHAPPGLKFTQNQPATLFYSIMVNRITLNLKGVESRDKDWTIEASRGSAPIGFRRTNHQAFDSHLSHYWYIHTIVMTFINLAETTELLWILGDWC